HILAYGVKEQFKPRQNFLEIIDKIHDLGGLAVCAHPLIPYYGVGRTRIKSFDGVEMINGREGHLVPLRLKGADQFMTGGSDAHTLPEVGHTVTRFPEPFSDVEELMEMMRCFKTGFSQLQHTAIFQEEVFPQVKNIRDYFSDFWHHRIKKL
ncbi:PHP-associated domain-containing protein, partial [Nanoarchaeota archaeon]